MRCNQSSNESHYPVTGRVHSGVSPRSLLSESIRSSQLQNIHQDKTGEDGSMVRTSAHMLGATFMAENSELGCAISKVNLTAIEHYSLAWKLDNLSKNMDHQSRIVDLGHWGVQHSNDVARLARYISPLIDDPELLHPKFQPIDQSKLTNHASALGQELRHLRIN